MIFFLLTILTLLPLLIISGSIFLRMRDIAHGEAFAQHTPVGGLTHVYMKSVDTARLTHKMFVAYKRLAMQYVFHIVVRTLFHIRAMANGAYTVARNRFMKNAVKSKASVSFFWSHLKEYKSQIEKERK